ncbi:hypothetical protein MJO28_003981 [Puccinia striiformis f. sp. tritici]|uniref:Uncharacterized protein n=1 Tax=Puccinia striiformis f. sp. tritici TaxID=168172 RepID=A0ACC0ENA6_9BASI|nr:hypothetical protein MJO28_003981 [Puccinia striiformis f. sp. tritici]
MPLFGNKRKKESINDNKAFINNSVSTAEQQQQQPQPQPPQPVQQQQAPLPLPPPPSSSSSSLERNNYKQPANPPPSTVIYPWSHRRLGLLPPAPFPADPSPPDPIDPAALRPSPPPFPRYGHSINPMGTPTGSGDIYIFAGLVKDQVKNDLYVLNVAPINPNNANPHLHNQILTVGLVETRGEVPLPRVGHASVGVGNVLIVWGGDTKTKDDEKQDDGLYLLNLSTREWTRVKVSGPCPEGRYGHSAAILGSKFYIFGGQTDNGRFMNDLWSFDLHKLKSGAPRWQMTEYSTTNPIPSERTGHTVVTFKDSIYVFGGTDGQYHYNDTWKLDISTGTWRELDCIGYIPLPREGHAATLVDDVMYVLGGRGVDGKDLDDLAAFKISNQRWYMFQNMGPAPAGRSGHSMASWQGKVYVLGGESYTSAKPDDPSIVHVLDTTKIKYPLDPPSGTRQQGALSSSHKSSDASLNDPSIHSTSSMGSRPPIGSSNLAPAESISNSETGPDRSPQRLINRSTSPATSRPRRPDDPPPMAPGSNPNNRRTISTSTARTMSPQQGSTTSRTMSPHAQTPTTIINESITRQSTPPSSQTAPRRSLENPSGQNSSSSARAMRTSQSNPTTAPTSRQSNSPVPRRVSAEITRMLNFTSSSTSKLGQEILSSSTNSQQRQHAHHHQHQHHQIRGSSSSISSSVVATNDSSSILTKQNGWMKAALAIAVQQGFTLPPSDENGLFTDERSWLMKFKQQQHDNGQNGLVHKDQGMQRLVEALVQLKRELNKAKNQMAEQAKHLDSRLNETSKTKTAALQEASFYRVKLAAYEAASVSEINKLERQRINDLEHRLSELIVSKSNSERQVSQLTCELDQERNLRELSQENSSKSHERSEQLQALHSQLVIDYEELLNKSKDITNSHDSSHQFNSLQSTHRSIVSELENTQLINQKYLFTLEHLQKSMDSNRVKIDELQNSWELTKTDLDNQKNLNQDLSRQLDSKFQELDQSKARIQEMEIAIKTVQEENLALKTLNEDGISQLISATRSVPSDLGSSTRALNEGPITQARHIDHPHSDQNDATQKLESAVLELSEARSRNMSLEVDLINSKSEISSLRRKMMNLMSESNQIKSQINSKNFLLKEKSRLIEAAEVKTSVLKNLMSENGGSGSGGIPLEEEQIGNRSFESQNNPSTFGLSGLLSTSLGSSNLVGANGDERLIKKIQELENELIERNRNHRRLEEQFQDIQKEMESAEHKYQDSHRKHEAAADEITSLVQEVQRLRSGGASSVSPASVEGHSSSTNTPTITSNATGNNTEEELAALNEKYRNLEQTHIKAVQYVKGTEKMLRRMKDELFKYKERTSTLESELNLLKSANPDHPSSSTTTEGNVGNNGKIRTELKGELLELTNQLSLLKESTKLSNLENDELNKKIFNIREEFELDLQHQNHQHLTKISSLDSQLKELIKVNDQLKLDYQGLINENNRLNSVLLSSKKSINRVIAADNVPSGSSHHGRSASDGNELNHSIGSSSSSSSLSLSNFGSNVNQSIEIARVQKENVELRGRCRDAEAKISLLLDHMDNRSEGNRRSTGLESIQSGSEYSGYGGVGEMNVLQQSSAAGINSNHHHHSQVGNSQVGNSQLNPAYRTDNEGRDLLESPLTPTPTSSSSIK